MKQKILLLVFAITIIFSNFGNLFVFAETNCEVPSPEFTHIIDFEYELLNNLPNNTQKISTGTYIPGFGYFSRGVYDLPTETYSYIRQLTNYINYQKNQLSSFIVYGTIGVLFFLVGGLADYQSITNILTSRKNIYSYYKILDLEEAIIDKMLTLAQQGVYIDLRINKDFGFKITTKTPLPAESQQKIKNLLKLYSGSDGFFSQEPFKDKQISYQEILALIAFIELKTKFQINNIKDNPIFPQITINYFKIGNEKIYLNPKFRNNLEKDFSSCYFKYFTFKQTALDYGEELANNLKKNSDSINQNIEEITNSFNNLIAKKQIEDWTEKKPLTEEEQKELEAYFLLLETSIYGLNRADNKRTIFKLKHPKDQLDFWLEQKPDRGITKLGNQIYKIGNQIITTSIDILAGIINTSNILFQQAKKRISKKNKNNQTSSDNNSSSTSSNSNNSNSNQQTANSETLGNIFDSFQKTFNNQIINNTFQDFINSQLSDFQAFYAQTPMISQLNITPIISSINTTISLNKSFQRSKELFNQIIEKYAKQ